MKRTTSLINYSRPKGVLPTVVLPNSTPPVVGGRDEVRLFDTTVRVSVDTSTFCHLSFFHCRTRQYYYSTIPPGTGGSIPRVHFPTGGTGHSSSDRVPWTPEIRTDPKRRTPVGNLCSEDVLLLKIF